WVLAFEIFIPLVLFFILLGLRQKKPAIPVKEAFYSAAPLTSAGLIPIMQSLCPDGQRDEFGFLQYKNSTVTQLLERIRFTVGSVLKNQSVFQQFLIRNLSLSNDTASLLLSTPVNLKEVYNLIFGSYPGMGGDGRGRAEGARDGHG
ncbi:hypothetical protein JZ751_001183, partial [Albula glossodonta]